MTFSSGPRIGYVPHDETLLRPADRRRFVYYANRRGLKFEIARPDQNYDVVIASLAADVTTWAAYKRGKLIFDFVDAYFEIPRTDAKSILRGLAKFATRETRRLALDYNAALQAMCRRADAVVCSTEAQQVKVAQLCPNVHRILDFHGTVAIQRKVDYSLGDTVNLAWEGLPDTLHFLKSIQGTLARLRKEHKVDLHVMTAPSYGRFMRGRYMKRPILPEVQAIFPGAYLYAWHERIVARIATACDIAIIPIPLEDPFARSKPENKLLYFWRIGMPTITSATPAYCGAMQLAGIQGTCSTEREWYDLLSAYIASEQIRRDAGERGFAAASKYYDEETSLARWDKVLESVLGADAIGHAANSDVATQVVES